MSKTITVWKEVEVDINLDDIDTNLLIDEIESRQHDWQVVSKKDLDDDNDAIYNLYQDYISLDGGAFEKKLKKFFEDSLGKVVF